MSRIHQSGTRTRWLGVGLIAWLTWLSFLCAAADAPVFRFQTNDVIAFVGGEDVVEMQRNGYLELLLTAALPHHNLRFRNLAFEGDTVFEQHRQLNFPSWEKQLESVGATVVIAQFGQAESLQGTNGLADFVAAYEKLLNRFTNGGRQIVLLAPTSFEPSPHSQADLTQNNVYLFRYEMAIMQLADRRSIPSIHFWDFVTRREPQNPETRDGLHLSREGHWRIARVIAYRLGGRDDRIGTAPGSLSGAISDPVKERLRQFILEKNRLWFDYWRPQNWAFLHGDRTEQPSSRDHRDPKKRWFPEEMEEFLPLIEAKEREIWEAAANLSKGK